MILRMRRTIDFDNEILLTAQKIYSIRTDRHLPDEFGVLQPAVTQFAPEPSFRWYSGRTKGASTTNIAAWREGHAASTIGYTVALLRAGPHPPFGHLLPALLGEGETWLLLPVSSLFSH